MNLSEQHRNALFRWGYGAVLIGAMTYLGVWQTTGDPHQGIAPAIYNIVAYLAARVGIEGTVDARRAKRGELIENPPTSVRS